MATTAVKTTVPRANGLAIDWSVARPTVYHSTAARTTAERATSPMPIATNRVSIPESAASESDWCVILELCAVDHIIPAACSHSVGIALRASQRLVERDRWMWKVDAKQHQRVLQRDVAQPDERHPEHPVEPYSGLGRQRLEQRPVYK